MEMHKVNNFFIHNIPEPHFVHKGFAKSINAVFVPAAPTRLPFKLIPLYNLFRIPLTFFRFPKQANVLCEGFAGLYVARILKWFRPQITIIYHDADALFFRDYPKYRGWKKAYVDYFLKSVDYAICDSELSKKHLSKHLKLKKEACVVYPFVNVAPTKRTEAKKTHTLLYLGRFAAEKNLHNLLYAFKKILKKDKKARLVLVGKGKLERELRALAKKLGIAQQTTFKGWTANINRHLDKADIGYNVADFEPFGCIGLEYPLRNVIPLLGKRNGNAEVLTDKNILTNPDNPQDIAAKIISILFMNEQEQNTLLSKLKKDAKKYNKKNQTNTFKKAFQSLKK